MSAIQGVEIESVRKVVVNNGTERQTIREITGEITNFHRLNKSTWDE
jgi:hypothetical protein